MRNSYSKTDHDATFNAQMHKCIERRLLHADWNL
jgi:hypothetical protein